ncbi:MAG TPA: hypothetical protein VKJ65_02635 [Phycisphaerae bacterium]|nr:hypothetical protein [Phycisphaerae bacterium]
MKTKYVSTYILSLAAGGLLLATGCVVEPDGRLVFQPVVIAAPPPVVVVPSASASICS